MRAAILASGSTPSNTRTSRTGFSLSGFLQSSWDFPD
jgi:hypothetical protein